jgi:hypothetical protein
MAFDLKSALSTIAPMLATMLGGPLAGTAVTALEGALGLSAGSGVDGITKVMQTGQMTPDQVSAIRAADQKHVEIMSQQQIDVIKINNDYQASIIKSDTDNVISARQSNVQGGTQIYLFFLSIIILGVGLYAEGFVLLNGVPKEVDDIVAGRILGTLDAILMVVLSYWYGTSHSSAVKTDIMAQSKN